MKPISSRMNEAIIAAKRLHQKKYRTLEKKFLAEGLRTCLTILESKKIPLIKLFATERGYATLTEHGFIGIITIVDENVMKKISFAETPSGIIGIFKHPQQPAAETIKSGIVLANVTDPGNAGTLIRSAVAFGAQSIVMIDGVESWHPKVIQASAGSIAHVDIFNYTWDNFLTAKKKSLLLYGLVAHNGIPLPSVKKNSSSLLVLGNEAHGLPIEWQRSCDYLVTIPMQGPTESLNAAAAGSIALYEIFGRN